MDNLDQEYIKIGRMLALSVSGEEIVITGIAARLPESNDVNQFAENLNKNVFMVSNDDRRWKSCYEDTPNKMGKINFSEKFDAGFFDLGHRQADFMDPHCRQLLERAVEAVADSGYSLAELRQTRTGVIVASTISDSKKILLCDKLESPSFAYEGSNYSMLANQISYHLELSGPSISTDSACSSSLYSIEEAYRSIKMGKYDNAIIAGALLILNPILNNFFFKLGLVSLDEESLVFDGKGCIRSEAAAVIFIQRAKDARRVYAQILHMKTNVDGFKEEGITFPSQQMISQLMKETFAECDCNPENLVVVEAHATGTKTGDPQELNAICQTLSKSRKTPLLIGSVKSSIGHTEPVAGLSSMIKTLLGMNNNLIYPNFLYHDHKHLDLAMMKRNLKVVSKTMVWPKNSSDLASVSSYGFGGANSFAILKRWPKDKQHSGVPRDDLPRLVCFSSRNQKCLEPILNDLTFRSLDEEYVRLWHAIYRYGVRNHPARGFVILSKSGEVKRSTGSFKKAPLCFVFGKFNNNWCDLFKQLSKIKLFKKNAERVCKILRGVSVIDKVKSKVVGNVAVQSALIDTLIEVGVVYDFVVGDSLGVLSAAYADGSLTLEQLILTARCLDPYVSNQQTIDADENICCINNNKNFETLKQKLKEIIPEPVPFSKKWIWESCDDGCMSAEFIVNRLTCDNFNFNVGKKFDKVVGVNFGRTSLKFNFTSSIDMLPQIDGDYVIDYLLTGLGRVYQVGYNLKLDKLYPDVPWPVSRKTPSISPLIKWIHDEDWFLYRHSVKPSDSVQTFDFSLKGQDPDWVFLSGHVFDGQCITPISAFVYFVWDTFSKITETMKTQMQVTFENVRMHKIVNILQQQHQKFVVRILKHSGKFEIEEMGDVVFSGKITLGADAVTPACKVKSEGLVLIEDEVYKQLRLRGYHYSGVFRGIKEYDVLNQTASVGWNNNWTAFIDNLVQLSLLQRNINHWDLPVGFEKLTIDVSFFQKNSSEFKEVLIHQDIITCEGLQLFKINTKTMKRQKNSSKTVLESLKFVPYNSKLSLIDALQVNLQIILENVSSRKLKVVEVVDQLSAHWMQWLTPAVQEVLQNSIAVQTDFVVFSKIPLQADGVAVVQKPLPKNASADLLITSNFLKNCKIDSGVKTINNFGFVLTREASSFSLNQVDQDVLQQISVVSDYECEQERLLLLRRHADYALPTAITINSHNFDWISKVQDLLKTNQKILLFVENDPSNGVIGFFNCLKLEHGRSDKIKCLFIPENVDHLEVNDDVVYDQLKKDLCINVLKNGMWGSYRNLALGPRAITGNKNFMLGNDLKWFAAPDRVSTDPKKSKIAVQYASVFVNSKMIVADDRCVLPMFDFSGIDSSGQRVMGFVIGEQPSSTVNADRQLLWSVPKNWTLEEAVTVPEPYILAIYILTVMAKLKPRNTILVHSLPSKTTEAIVNIAKYNKCTVFITNQNKKKLAMLEDQYKNTPNSYVGNFNSVVFKREIRKRGGAQVIVNSSTNKNLHSLSDCLAPHGTLFQVGNCKPFLSLGLLSDCKYVVVDVVLALEQELIKNNLHALIRNGLITNMIKPLKTKLINRQDINGTLTKLQEEIVVKVRDGQERFFCTPRFYCNNEHVYVVIGGLGGIGLEFIDWLIERGAQKITVCSRSSALNGYQKLKLSSWKNQSIVVNVSVCDVSTEKGCLKLLQFAGSIGPVGGIFNLAVILKDEFFELQSVETFKTPFLAKAFATEHLDKISRNLCSDLQHFVVFSSSGSSIGSVGQTNYNMTNSSMERICERRKADGYPALAVQWGAIAEVGIVPKLKRYSSDKIFRGTVQQSLRSCFEHLDRFLTEDETVVLHINLANALPSATHDYRDGIKNIIGITNMKTISHYMTFPSLGMDSISIVEVQSYLETNHGLCMDIAEIRTLTFAKLDELISQQ